MGKDIKIRLARNSIRYNLLKIYARLIFKLYYKKIYVFGRENIPQGYPLIFAPNHQNAVMDPLAVLFTAGMHIVFLARADVFKGRRMIDFLNFLKILPVYRQRDGVENLEKNNEVFEITIDLLKKHKAVCLMPEGKHGEKHWLQPLVKGMFRIAFNAQEQLTDPQKGVQIIPVGLYYHHYVKMNQPLVINFSKPISVENYMDLYREKPAFAINQLKDDLSVAISESMIDIQDMAYYDSFNFIQYEYAKGMLISGNQNERGKKQFMIQQKMVHVLHHAVQRKVLFMPQLNHFTGEYMDLLKKYRIRDWVVRKGKSGFARITGNFLLLILGALFFVYGYLVNWVPFHTHRLITRNIKDIQFHSSVKYVLSIIILPLYYLITSILVGFLCRSLIIALVFVVFSPILGFIALRIYSLYKKTIARIRFRKLIKCNHRDAKQLITLRSKIFTLAGFLYNEYSY